MEKTSNEIIEKENIARGHNLRGKPIPNWDLQALKGAGAIKSSISNMLKYLESNINADESKTVISTQVHDPIFSGDKKHVGITWFTSEDKDGYKIINHKGATGGYVSNIKFTKDRKFGVVVLSNSTLAVTPVANLVFDLLKIKKFQ